MNFNGIIYMWTCIPSNKSYIGQTIDEKRRENKFWNGDNEYTSEGSKICNARKKYGVERDTWVKTILEEIEADDKEELKTKLNELEIYYIKKYDTYNNGYNSTKGGNESYNPSQETKSLISSKMAEYHSLNHHHVKKEVAQKISQKRKLADRKNVNSAAKTIRRLSVNQIDPKTDKTLKTFPSMEAASKETGISASSIRMVCRHDKRKTAGGYKWEFSDENTDTAKKETKGFYWHKALKRWVAKIKVNGKSYTLGYFINENAAKEMYLTAKEQSANGAFMVWLEDIFNVKENIMKRYGEA